MSEKTRVVFFHISSDSFGGGSLMLVRLLRNLNKDEFQPVLLSQDWDEVARRSADDGISVRIVPFKGALKASDGDLLSPSPHQYLELGPRILQFNKDVWTVLRETDIVYCRNIRAVLTILPFALTSEIPLLWNVGLGLRSKGVVAYLNWIALRIVDHVFIESETQARRVFGDDLYRKHDRKFYIFYKGIDTETFSPSLTTTNGQEGNLIGTAALLTKRKRIEDLIRAMTEIRRRHPDTELVIAGSPEDGEYVSELHNLVDRLDLREAVEFEGWVDDMPSFLETLDVFVLPSANEGVPGSVREAMAMEVPVVATDVGGTSEAVRNEITGLLVPPSDSNAIANAVIRLLSDPERAREMAKRGRERAKEHFTVDSYVSNYERMLREISQSS